MNTLDKDVVIKGSIASAQQLMLDGTVEGDISSGGTATIGESALVKGTIKTGAAIVFGKVEGNITVQGRCEVKSTATIIGDIAGRPSSSKKVPPSRGAPASARPPWQPPHQGSEPRSAGLPSQ